MLGGGEVERTEGVRANRVGAAVVLCQQASGVPFAKKTKQILTEAFLAGPSQPKDLAYAITDEQGRFSFENTPLGEYRLVAQSWPDADSIKGLIAVNGKILQRLGYQPLKQMSKRS